MDDFSPLTPEQIRSLLEWGDVQYDLLEAGAIIDPLGKLIITATQHEEIYREMIREKTSEFLEYMVEGQNLDFMQQEIVYLSESVNVRYLGGPEPEPIDGIAYDIHTSSIYEDFAAENAMAFPKAKLENERARNQMNLQSDSPVARDYIDNHLYKYFIKLDQVAEIMAMNPNLRYGKSLRIRTEPTIVSPEGTVDDGWNIIKILGNGRLRLKKDSYDPRFDQILDIDAVELDQLNPYNPAKLQ